MNKPWKKYDSEAQKIAGVSEDDYFAAYADYMSSHKLEDFRKSPAYYKAKIDGKIPRIETSAFTVGTATHKLILEGFEAFQERYLVSDGPINPRTGKAYGRDSQKFQDWLKEVHDDEMEVVSESEYADMQAMQNSVNDHELASDLLVDGKAEVTIRGKLLGVQCQSRLDWVSGSEGKRVIVDLKTCRHLGYEHTASKPCKFARDFHIFGYDRQMAFYQLMLAASEGVDTPDDWPEVFIIAVEKTAPYEVGVFQLSEATLQLARSEVCATLRKFKACQETGEFHSNFRKLVTI